MLYLSVIAATSELPRQPNFSDPAVQIWYENDGSVSAWGYIEQGYHWMGFPEFATYRFSLDSDEVVVFPHHVAQIELIWDTFYRNVVPMVIQAKGQEALHASAVLTENGVIAFCAVSETGKSTFAYGLSQRGYVQWADDAVTFKCLTDEVFTDFIPFVSRLRPTSAHYFGLDQFSMSTLVKPITEIKLDSAPLSAIYVLERAVPKDLQEEFEIQKLLPVRAFPAILAHAYCFSLGHTHRKKAMMKNYMELVNKVPIFQIRFSAGIEKLPDILDSIEHNLSSLTTPINQPQESRST